MPNPSFADRQVEALRLSTSSSSAAASLAEQSDTILKKLTTLDEGWNGYEGLPVQHNTARRAREFLKSIEEHTQVMLGIVPLSNGGLQLEWFVGAYEVEVEIDTSPSGSLHVSFECLIDERCVDFSLDDPGDISGIASYFKELRQ